MISKPIQRGHIKICSSRSRFGSRANRLSRRCQASGLTEHTVIYISILRREFSSTETLRCPRHTDRRNLEMLARALLRAREGIQDKKNMVPEKSGNRRESEISNTTVKEQVEQISVFDGEDDQSEVSVRSQRSLSGRSKSTFQQMESKYQA
ncbi:hypothetical protein SUGI_0913890 [Cryptomeria japonica]|nr:hypothetical protein SUGI_0913890 [Cryptomeria japonica]